MKNETKKLYNAYVARIAHLNGVTTEDVREGFNVLAAPEQKLKEKVVQSSQFLQWINTPTVTSAKGEMIGLGVAQTIASTTDTTVKDRETKDLLNLDKRTYNCEQVNFDSHIRWARLDEWAKHPDFQEKVASQTQKTIALNLIMMGWNGTSRASTSNPGSNNLLQDVKKGWLQQLREDTAGTKVMSGVDTHRERCNRKNAKGKLNAKQCSLNCEPPD